MKRLQQLIYTTFISAAILSGCGTQEPYEPETGLWRGTIDVQGNELPFNFELTSSEAGYQIYLLNGDEKLLLDEVDIDGDSIYIPMHIFDADIKAVVDDGKWIGKWTKNYEDDYSLDFTAEPGVEFRFEPSDVSTIDFDGKWEVTFIDTNDGDTTISVGIFDQEENYVTGTFLTPIGDYRYLEGIVRDETLYLSAYDGGHAFLFTAEMDGEGALTGNFWSGKSSHETWTAQRNENAALPHPDSLTYLVEGYENIDFSFPGLDGNPVSPGDERFDGKVLILQIFGTWCPNCMDETRFLAKWYDDNKDRGVEILGLAYEAKDDFEYAKARIEKMQEKLGVNYDFVVAGTKDKAEASKTLPMLNRILSFPTTIIIDKKGNLRKIHTGFTGPGTGRYYDEFQRDFNLLIDKLVEEEG